MKKLQILFFSLVSCVGAFAAPNSLYFMDLLPYQVYQNPAMRPLSDVYVEIPGISTVGASLHLGSLSLNDVAYVKDGKLVTFLHPEYGNQAGFYNKLQNTEHFRADAYTSFLGFGFKQGEKGYLSFNLSAKADALLSVPKEFLGVLLEGTPDTLGVNRFDMSNTALRANLYLDLSAGYSHQINEQWQVGGRVHLLLGAASIHTTYDQFYLDASKDEWTRNAVGKSAVSLPGLTIVDGEPYMEDIETALVYYRPSMGAAFDLGAVYKPLPELSLSLSLTDLGFMVWDNSLITQVNSKATYDGVEYEAGVSPIDELTKELGSLLVLPKGVAQSRQFVSELRGKLYVGAEYSFLRNMMSVGLLSKTEFMSKYVSEEVSLNYKIRPCHCFEILAGYSFVSGGWSTMSFAMDLKLPPFNFYVATDYVPFHYSPNGLPYKSQALNVQAGVVLTFNTKDNVKRLKGKLTEPEVVFPEKEPTTLSEPVDVPAATDPQAVPEPAEVETSVSNTTVTETVTEKVEEVQGDEVGGTNVVKL